LGIGLVPQGRRIFSSLTVNENLEVPYKGPSRSEKDFSAERVFGIFPILKERKDQRGGKLSGVSNRCLPQAAAYLKTKTVTHDEPLRGWPVVGSGISVSLSEVSRSRVSPFFSWSKSSLCS